MGRDLFLKLQTTADGKIALGEIERHFTLWETMSNSDSIFKKADIIYH